MKRYILFVLLAICTVNGFAQSSMTDSQVMDFVVKEHNRGASQAQIVTKLMQNGVDISQIRRVRDTYEKMKKGNAAYGATTESSTTDRSRKNNGQQRPGRNKRQIADATLNDYEQSRRETDKIGRAHV